MNNQSNIIGIGNQFYEKYVSDQYLLSKGLQDEYLLAIRFYSIFKKIDWKNQMEFRAYTPYLSTWILPQMENIQFNYPFFKDLKKYH